MWNLGSEFLPFMWWVMLRLSLHSPSVTCAISALSQEQENGCARSEAVDSLCLVDQYISMLKCKWKANFFPSATESGCGCDCIAVILWCWEHQLSSYCHCFPTRENAFIILIKAGNLEGKQADHVRLVFVCCTSICTEDILCIKMLKEICAYAICQYVVLHHLLFS